MSVSRRGVESRTHRGSNLAFMVAFLAGSLFALGFGCGNRSRGAQPVDVAGQIDDEQITMSDLRSGIRTESRSGGVTSHEQVENAIRFEVLAKEARDKGYGRDPSVMHAAKQQMIALLVKDHFGKEPAGRVPEEDIERYYAEHASSYRRDRVEVQAIVVSTQAKAASVAAAVGALPHDDARGFERLVAQYSEDPISKAKGGSLGTLDRSSSGVPVAVLDAALSLTDQKPVSAAFPAAAKVYILRLVSRTNGVSHPLSEVHEEIARRPGSQMRAKEMDTWTAAVRSGHAVEMNEAQMAKLTGL